MDTPDGRQRPCLECGESVDWDDIDQLELHLHETGLPGRMWEEARRRRRRSPRLPPDAAANRQGMREDREPVDLVEG